MKIIDVIKKIKEKDYTDDQRLWFEGIEFRFVNPDGSSAKFVEYEDNENNEFEYNELEITDYYFYLNTEYLNFVIIRCNVLLKEAML